MRPMKSKPFEKLSKNQLSNFVGFFDFKEGFSLFRQISKKFYQCHEQYLIFLVTQVPNLLAQYSPEAITDAKNEIKNNLTIVDRINFVGRQIREIRGAPKTPTESKMFMALRLLKKNQLLRVSCEADGKPKFEVNDVGFLNDGLYEDVKKVMPRQIKLFKKFIDFYGPRKQEYEDFKRTNKVVEDAKMDYINMILEYWFVQRQKLKARSLLHEMLLLAEERSFDIKVIQNYFKKYKPKLKIHDIQQP
mmetsp:Transcript_35845/g.26628  ORF Transcript_35845/g.26628 Transcript_35845/m.26628 type:complete len:247 (-) Transcript_35845:35-775(-)